MDRFFVSEEAIKDDRIVIDGRDFNHIAHSLRLEPGDKITVNDGQGLDYTVKLMNFCKTSVSGKIINRKVNKNEPGVKITLVQAIPKNRNMEFVIQKCTEIGVEKIIPLQSERTVVQLKNKKKDKRIKRWQRIAREAAKQSERGIIPQVKDVHTISEIIKLQDSYDLTLVCWTGEQSRSIKKIISDLRKWPENILLIIGPEGGLSEKEVRELNGETATLGPRILRTETAGMAASAILLSELGEMGGK